MKKVKALGRKGKGLASLGESPTEIFLRGFLAAGLLTAVRDRLDPDEPTANSRKVLRHALQGGFALTGATLAARGLARRDYGLTTLAAGLATAGVIAAEYALRPAETAGFVPAIEEPNRVEEEEE
ncbi:hypothetical protein [Phaeospirillum tilakii]|uniref:Uncharacterized protein n=1 Tax=Phaeospirillum tilakii TaxID=741673 RepID=A0ABW5C6I9_9PROT